jgi:hypothetical protein
MPLVPDIDRAVGLGNGGLTSSESSGTKGKPCARHERVHDRFVR